MFSNSSGSRSIGSASGLCVAVILLLSASSAYAAVSVPKPVLHPSVRVLIAENQKEVRLTVKGDYVLRALPSLRILKAGKELNSQTLSPAPAGIKVGGELFPFKGIRVEPGASRDLFFNKSRFRGFIDLRLDGSTGTLYAVNQLDIEGYLYGVLHHEVAHWWPMEALEAQAIAARTYALYEAQMKKTQPYDLRSSTASQVYGGSTIERFRTKRAVDQTAGQVLLFQGKLFPAYFHATCAGVTAAASELWNVNLPPLAGGVKCEYCKISPHFYWNATVPLSGIEEKMKKYGRSVGQILKIEQITQTPSGRVGSLRITGTTSEVVVAAKDFRVWVGGDRIRSTFFSVDIKEDMAEFKGEGWGHGVGLCQWGALGQSLLGRTHDTILKFYYPGAEIKEKYNEK